ncbi:MAG: hypothetical protein AAF728_09465 [Cyanobacteria bacterium P01_D01_bin.128]
MNNEDGYMNECEDRGLLDLSVALSTRDITAGKDFTIFVLIKNPFDKQAWIRKVDVSLPSELEIAPKRQPISYYLLLPIQSVFRYFSSYFHPDHLIDSNLKSTANKKTSKKSTGETLNREKPRHEMETDGYRSTTNMKISGGNLGNLEVRGPANISLQGGDLGNVDIYSKSANLLIGSEPNSEGLDLGNVTIYDPKLIAREQSESGTISLSGSLPKNNALQPGCTTVYAAVLAANRPFVFTPSQYRLQFNVQYSFKEKPLQYTEKDKARDKIFSNTVSHELSIRPSVGSMLFGGGFGGAVGSFSRILQVTPERERQLLSRTEYPNFGASIALAVILSCVSIVFMARKSDAQSFISVEDFWGGLLIGFLVGYTGTSFFEQLTGFSPDMESIPAESEIIPDTQVNSITPESDAPEATAPSSESGVPEAPAEASITEEGATSSP